MKRPTIQIIYATAGGNTQLVCEAVAFFLERSGFSATLTRAELADPQKVKSQDILILACPTYGEGILEPTNFAPFFRAIQKEDFEGYPVAVIGLGDPKYGLDYCLESANILEGFFKKKKAKLLLPSLRVVKSPVPQINTQVKKWAEKLIEALNNLS